MAARQAKEEKARPDTMKRVAVSFPFFLRCFFGIGMASNFENHPDGKRVIGSISDTIRFVSSSEKANRQPARKPR